MNYNLGLVIKPLPNGSIYAAYATSSNPVGAELDASSSLYGGLSPTATNDQVFSPEENKSVEIGTKWEFFNKRLLATAALFETTKENARETVGANIIAGAEYRVRGIDLGLSGNITDDWSVSAGVVLLDTKVEKSSVATNVGLKLANIADRSFNVLSKYRLNETFEVGGQVTYASRIHGGTLAANANVLPSHWRVDAFTEAKVTKDLHREGGGHQHLRRTILRRLLPERDALRLRRARPHGLGRCSGEILGNADADLRA